MFKELTKILQTGDADKFGVSELHGMMCGVLIADFSFSFEYWLDEMKNLDRLTSVLMGNKNVSELKTFFLKVAKQFAVGDLHFQILLPGDEVSFQERVVALSEWCAGFIYGFGIQNKVSIEDLSKDGKILFDQIVALDSYHTIQTEASSENEADYLDIKKFISMEVLLLSEQIQNNKLGKQEH